jgi:predicted enzyme related to lactoylglutathione lyase
MKGFEKPNHGQICWQELNTKDLSAASKFYGGLFGWKLEQAETTETTYKEIHTNGKASGGMHEINDCWGEHWQKIPSYWLTYIAVADIAESVEKIKKFGGSIRVEPFEAPGVGKMSVALDPSGIAFSIIQFV